MTSYAIRAQTLRRGLRANSVFSAMSGGALVAASPAFASLFSLSDPRIFLVIGVSLMVFAVGVFLTARREPIRLAEARVIVAGDVGWVLGSVGLLLFAPEVIGPAGRALVGVIAAIVAAFAVIQYRGVRQLN